MKEIKHDPAAFHVSLKVLLKNDQNEFLLLKANSKTDFWHDTWDFPGGRINQDEIDVGFHQLMDREIKEEIGNIIYELRPDPVALAKCIYEGAETERFFILFEAKYLGGKIELSKEHSEYVWRKITPNNIDKHLNQVIKQLMNNYFEWNRY